MSDPQNDIPMPVDLTAIRALLASVAGFTPGPWRVEQGPPDHYGEHVAFGAGGLANTITGELLSCSDEDGRLIAAAPDLHRELTEAVGEIERLRAVFAKVAEVAADASKSHAPGSVWWLTRIVAALPGWEWADVPAALRRLAAGEVDDV